MFKFKGTERRFVREKLFKESKINYPKTLIPDEDAVLHNLPLKYM